MLHPDFSDMLRTLCAHNVDFIVVGAHAMAAHGFVRATGDIDIWVRPTTENAARVWDALREFGAPLSQIQPSDLATAGTVFQIGVAPVRIDLLTAISGVSFDDGWSARQDLEIEGMNIAVLSREHLLANKRASGRAKDLADVVWLESNEPE